MVKDIENKQGDLSVRLGIKGTDEIGTMGKSINQFIITLKDTSILSVIGFPELVNTSKNVVANTGSVFEVWAVVAVMYLIVITLLSYVAKMLERRLNRGR